MSRTKGARNKKTLARIGGLLTKQEIVKRRSALVKTDSVDTAVPLDSLAVLEEVMRHFYFKAKVLQAMGERADWEQVDRTMEQVGRWAKEVAVFRHAKLSSMKLAGDPNAPLGAHEMTMDQLRQAIMEDLSRLSGVLELDSIRVPQGIENRPVINGDGSPEEQA